MLVADRQRFAVMGPQPHTPTAPNAEKGSAYVDGFGPEGKICRTNQLLTNVGGKRTMTAAGPTRSFGPPPEGRIVTEELPKVNTCHEQYFENYKKAYRGEEEFLIKIPESARAQR